MKRFYTMAALLLLSLSFLSANCHHDPQEDPLVIDGQWQITQFSTKTVNIGDQPVDIYINFISGGSFEMYQMLGTGRYRKFTGTWNLTDKLLSGSYSDGQPWASTYEVSMDEARTLLTLTSTATPQEVSTYRKQTIPQDVINNAL